MRESCIVGTYNKIKKEQISDRNTTNVFETAIYA